LKRSRFARRQEEGPRREPTAEERAAFDELLLGEDLEAAEAQALDYALGLTGKNETMARQMVLHARTLLWERCSWKPDKAPLGAYLCGIIRSERGHDARHGAIVHRHEVEYFTEVATLDGPDARSPEQLALEEEERLDDRDAARAELKKFEDHFVSTRDEVNLDWIKYSLEGIEDLAEMAKLSGRDVKEFYRARDRRVRYVERLLAEKRGEPQDDEE